MADSDIEDALLADGPRDATPRDRRREMVDKIVLTLGEFISGLDGRDERSRASVGQLMAILQTMTDSIASADDKTFTAIMREAALLMRTLKERQTYFSKYTIH
ncbi:hypothetical protein [Rhizobium anhuiense]|uniref:Uncharacterized protein n=1 Tax=Rhizobium anhuiense TaxID=1184720 RepID=A0A432NKY0_9HYPH|nr:hypothetical protein [Rhizobium anhuiense]RUM00285.1 hypothetical protein EEQ99_18225 [Rhizobium anhuiense]GGD88733.1 hypothetical protein GCM10008012_35530 [Rhizobium anhuiense]